MPRKKCGLLIIAESGFFGSPPAALDLPRRADDLLPDFGHSLPPGRRRVAASRGKQRQRSEARIASRATFLTSSKDGRSKGGEATTRHKTGMRDEWLAARLQLLEAEKGLFAQGR